MTTLQDKSREQGRSINALAYPDCTRCQGSGWYMVGLGGDFEDCDCTVTTDWEPEDRFEITGRGTLFTGRFPLKTKGAECIGRRVRVKGEVWEIIGYDKMSHALPLSFGHACGLLTKPYHFIPAKQFGPYA